MCYPLKERLLNYNNINNIYLYNIKYYSYNNIDILFIFNFLKNSKKIELFDVNFLYNYRFKTECSNYNINILYSSAIAYTKNKEYEVLNSYTNIFKKNKFRLKYYKNKFLKKTAIIDLLLKKYIETYINTKVNISFDQYSINFFKHKNIYIKAIRRKLRRVRKMIKNSGISLRTFIRVMIVFLCTKDMELFIKVLLKIMNSMHYKNHRKFLYFLKLFINRTTSYYFNILRFSGFLFTLSGKISGGGNSKKRRYHIRCGKYSLTTKSLKIKFKKGIVHTRTGVLGYRFIISYI